MPHADDRPLVVPPEALLGRVIGGKFRIETALGAGGMGNVYRAEQLSLGKAVALKVLHRELMTDEVVVKRFEREARSVSRLDHPNLVQVIDFGRDDETGLLFIAMELLSGRDLGQVLAQRVPLAVPRAVRIIGQVLSGLEEAHAGGVVHRDLKPANIMLIGRRASDVEQVKVCDFGVAKAGTIEGLDSAQLTVRGFVWGTPEYMCPEQARGEDVDARADLYAVGAVLYHMLTGEVVFTASSPVGVLAKHLGEMPARVGIKRPDVPRALEALVARALEKDPQRRPASAREFREALEAACPAVTPAAALAAGQAGTLAALASPVTRTARLGRRNWRSVAMAGGLVLVLGLGVWFAAFQARPGNRPGSSSTPPAMPEALAATSAPAPMEPVAVEVAAEAPSAAEAPAAAAAVREPEAPAPARRPRPTPRRADQLRPAAPALALALPELPRAPTPPPSSPAPAEEPRPAPRGPNALAEGERLLGQGDVTGACARGEDARQASPRNPSVHKFLGKCYLRAGDSTRARQSYRTYLELAPDAADATFIRSIVK